MEGFRGFVRMMTYNGANDTSEAALQLLKEGN